mmetsp:Transcript_13665/g.15880  ORF Transcript_13665/g.15880 Transcript_13665/m.15880 type:complete len:149 (+) Transcript_13665:47-493(+)
MAESLIRVRNLAGALVLETSHSDSLEELQKKTSEACGAPAGILRFVKDNEPLTTLENVTDEVVLIVDESPYYSWEIARNPDRQYLKGSEAMVEFVDPQNLSHPDYVNVLSQVTIDIQCGAQIHGTFWEFGATLEDPVEREESRPAIGI